MNPIATATRARAGLPDRRGDQRSSRPTTGRVDHRRRTTMSVTVGLVVVTALPGGKWPHAVMPHD